MQHSTPDSLKWTHTRSRLCCETYGKPALELEMDCHIGAAHDGRIRWQRAKALWDTGTSISVITPELADRLGLKPDNDDYIVLNRVGGVSRAWLSVAFVGFPNNIVCGPIRVAVRELPSTDVLIGMDVISNGTFAIRRKPDGGTLFTFDMNI